MKHGKKTKGFDLDKFFEEKTNEFSKIGKVITVLNLIEQNLVISITIFFTIIGKERPIDVEKSCLLNDILWDDKIDLSFEQKRRMLIKIIKRIGRISSEKNIEFSKDRYLDICKSISRVEQWRNDLAHKYISYDSQGAAVYMKRKGDEELLEDRRQGKKGTIKYVKIDLDKILKESKKIYEESEMLLTEMQGQINKVLPG